MHIYMGPHLFTYIVETPACQATANCLTQVNILFLGCLLGIATWPADAASVREHEDLRPTKSSLCQDR